MPNPPRPVLALLLAALALSGCSALRPLSNAEGYVAQEDLVSAIAPGIDNRESVQRALGDPTLVAQWDNNVWYYVTRLTKQRAFIRPAPREQQILIVHFDKDGNVASVERRGMEEVANISPNGDKTPTLGRDHSIFDDLFGNIGQVGAMGPTGPGNDNTGP